MVEVMISLGMVIIAMAAASSLLVSSGNLLRNAQEIADSNDAARLGGERVVGALRIAGMGGTSGIWVAYNGTPYKINAVFGYDGTTGAGYNGGGANANGYDELWVVTPTTTALGQGCTGTGGSSVVLNSGIGMALSVTCTSSFSITTPQQPLLVSNLNSAALITPTTILAAGPFTAGSIAYTESGINLSDSPEHGGFQKGDLVYGARVYHFYVGATSTSTGLYQAQALPGTDASRPGIPFKDVSGTAQVMQDHIEDFQVAFGLDTSLLGNPDNYVFQPGLLPNYVPTLRAVRITMVSIGKQAQKTNNNHAESNYVALTAENHVPLATTKVGYRRSVYRRRVEVLNLALNQL
jgi:hypothetical protein